MDARGRRLQLVGLAIVVAAAPAYLIGQRAGCPTGPLDVTAFAVLVASALFGSYNAWRNTTR
jgi:hypothetical protein